MVVNEEEAAEEEEETEGGREGAGMIGMMEFGS